MRSHRVDGRALLWRVSLLTLLALAGCTGAVSYTHLTLPTSDLV